MGLNSSSCVSETIGPDGLPLRTLTPFTHHVLHERTAGGRKVITVTRKADYWVGTEVFTPFPFGTPRETAIFLPTLQEQARTEETPGCMIDALKGAPSWMQGDVHPSAVQFFRAHPIKYYSELVGLKHAVPLDVYRAVATETLERRLMEDECPHLHTRDGAIPHDRR